MKTKTAGLTVLTTVSVLMKEERKPVKHEPNRREIWGVILFFGSCIAGTCFLLFGLYEAFVKLAHELKGLLL